MKIQSNQNQRVLLHIRQYLGLLSDKWITWKVFCLTQAVEHYYYDVVGRGLRGLKAGNSSKSLDIQEAGHQ